MSMLRMLGAVVGFAVAAIVTLSASWLGSDPVAAASEMVMFVPSDAASLTRVPFDVPAAADGVWKL
jgi:hypothetical protein